MDVSAVEMKHLQESDPTLEVRKLVEVKESKSGVGFFKKNNMLYRRWIPKG